jgi:hypothetical protein|tara:strand:- start:1293 stop:1481 length:189 start_codon:yes stop_codon:yes gene_type:complete
MQYQIFVVTEEVWKSVSIGAYFQGGICVDGTYDDELDKHLLITRHSDELGRIEPTEPLGNEL